MTWMQRLVGLFTGLALALASSAAGAACGRDVDCEGDLICEAGSCVAARPPAPVLAPAAPALAPPAPVLAPPAPAPPAKMERNSPAMMAGGIAMVVLGGVSVTGALVLAVSQSLCSWNAAYDEETGQRNDECALDVPPGAVFVFGLASIGGGIALTVIGAKHVPAPNGARATLTPWVGARGAGASFRLEL